MLDHIVREVIKSQVRLQVLEEAQDVKILLKEEKENDIW